MIEELKKYLSQITIIKIADLISLYETDRNVRFQKNWTAYCKKYEADDKAIYCGENGSLDNSERNFYSKDLKFSEICEIGRTPKIDFSPQNYPEFCSDDDNPEIIKVKNGNFKFEDNKIYEIFENYTSFEYDAFKYINKESQKTQRDFNRIFRLKPYSKELPNEREKQIEICADESIPILTIQGPPGTGKTSFLADLIIKLIEKGIRPGDIVCLAQTNRAADEIRNKLRECQDVGLIEEDAFSRHGEYLGDCPGKIYISTIYKNRSISEVERRKFVLIDEASQIPIPLLLYALRYAKDDAVLRFFGDQRQLGPVSSYVRDISKVPDVQRIEEHYFRNSSDEIKEFLKLSCNCDSYEEMFSKDFLKKIEKETLLSYFSQSIFSIQNVNFGNNSLISNENIKALESYNIVRLENFRQEPELHEITHNVFYNEYEGHKCQFDVVSANLKDCQNYTENERDNFLKFISNNLDTANRIVNRFLNSFQNNVNIITRFLSVFVRNIFNNEQEKQSLKQYPPPFIQISSENYEKYIEEFVKNEKILKEIKEGLNEIDEANFIDKINKLKGKINNKVLVIIHNFQQEEQKNINKLESLLSCLFLFLWKKEKHRVGRGFGVVVPYRSQEVYTKQLYLKAFGNSENISFATPERFQGRDISRAIYCVVNSKIENFEDISNMFSANKLNVGTSRASSQQILIAHKKIVNNNFLKEFRDYIDGQENEIDKKILEEYPLKYLESLKKYVDYAHEKGFICNIEL